MPAYRKRLATVKFSVDNIIGAYIGRFGRSEKIRKNRIRDFFHPVVKLLYGTNLAGEKHLFDIFKPAIVERPPVCYYAERRRHPVNRVYPAFVQKLEQLHRKGKKRLRYNIELGAGVNGAENV